MQEKDSTFFKNIILYNIWLFFGWKITVKMKKKKNIKSVKFTKFQKSWLNPKVATFSYINQGIEDVKI